MVALRKQSAIIERQRTNSKGVTYSQWFADGKMVGCGCDEAKAVHTPKYNFKPCKHMTAHNNAYEGCAYCGRNHKSWNCPF